MQYQYLIAREATAPQNTAPAPMLGMGSGATYAWTLKEANEQRALRQADTLRKVGIWRRPRHAQTLWPRCERVR